MGDAQDTRFTWDDIKNALVNDRLREARYRWELRQAELLDAMMSAEPGQIIRFERIEKLPDPVAEMAAPSCEMCGTTPWILTNHPLSGKSVCLECKTKGFEGWVPCPATHKDGMACVLCRKTPGFIEEA